MANRFWVGGTGTWNTTNTANWSATSNGAGGASAPVAGDAVVLDANSGTGTITLGANVPCFLLTMGNYAGTLDFNNFAINIGGNNATVFSGGPNYTLAGTPNLNFTYSGSVGTRTMSSGASASLNSTLNYNVTAGTDIIIASSFRSINFTGFSGTFNNTARVVFGDMTFSATMTVAAGANTTTFSRASGTQTITTNGKTLDFPLAFNGANTVFVFQDALTQGSTRNFTLTNGTVQLKNGVTSTVGNFITSGTARKFLQSTVAGSQATLSEAAGTVNASYLTIQDINATGGATWNAYVDQFNVDAGNVDGWDFGISPVVGGAEYTYQLRSFTEPRRF